MKRGNGRTSGIRRLAWPAAAAVVVLAAWAAGCSDEGPPTDPGGDPGPGDEVVIPPEPFEGTASTITELEILSFVSDIAHDSTLGRHSPSPELNEVARYIAAVFSEAGLTPAGDDGYLQWYEVAGPAEPPAPNVIGWVRGSDPDLRDEFVVLSAHFDHLGGVDDGPGPDRIFNGADDNASGTAALLEIAGAIGAMPVPPKRSVVFLAASGEELGLRGSIHYMGHAPFPPQATVANLNFDMIGRGESDHLWLIHEVTSDLAPIAIAVAAQHPGLGLTPEDRPDNAFTSRSDSGAFVLYGIDALFFHSGLHAEYHEVSDEVELLDTKKIERVAKLGYWVAVELAGRP